jgi:transcriptional regulator of acetoin/glycerol metabolism
MLENLYFLSCFKDRCVIRFHSRPEFVTTLHEGLLSFDEDGTIVAANRAAAFQMDLDDQSRLIGKNIEEVFGWPASSLIDIAGRHPDDPVELHHSRDGRGFFGVARRPVQETARHAGAGQGSTDRRLRKGAQRGVALDELHYGDPVIANNSETAKKIMGCDIPFIIYGKTGTGKGLFAKALHETSQRSGKPFVAVNCAAIPEALIESELFGYKKGAFTGADKQGRRGKILQAQEGTLFLDEIGDMPLALQARLLRVLEEHEVTPLGTEEPVKVDIQVISATHQDLNELVLENRFREDLFYRLQGAAFIMPNLADRLDRRALILALVERWAAANRKVSLEPKALECLERYEWPGNVRQLCLTLRTILALVEGDKITVNDIPANIRSKNSMKLGVIYEAGDRDLLEAAERSALLHALENKRWNIAKVARSLNMSRNTLYRKIKRLGIKM